MGGGRSSQGLTSASGGFGWSNYNPRNVGAAGFLGRSAPAYCSNYSDADRAGKTVSKQDQIVTTQTDDGSVPPECEFGCDWDRGAESVEQLVLCALCLVLVALARIFFSALVVHVFKRELPASMTFPMWEGPGNPMTKSTHKGGLSDVRAGAHAQAHLVQNSDCAPSYSFSNADYGHFRFTSGTDDNWMLVVASWWWSVPLCWPARIFDLGCRPAAQTHFKWNARV